MTKLRVLLVDDEPIILEGLSVLIDWEAEGCKIVKTASNGKEAYEYLLENEVDLILADIKMPIMTGLELLEKIRTENISDAYFAILSGYNDFSFAQKAIRYSCMEYMLKPVAKEQLLELISKVLEQRKNIVIEEEEKKTWQRSYLIQNLSALIRGKWEPEVLTYVKENLPFAGTVRYVQIVPENADSLEELSDNEIWELRDGICENCRKYLGEDGDYCVKAILGEEEEYEISFLYSAEMAKKHGVSMEEFMSRLLDAASQRIGIPLVMLVGKEVEDIARISNSYSSACVLKSSRGFRTQKKIY